MTKSAEWILVRLLLGGCSPSTPVVKETENSSPTPTVEQPAESRAISVLAWNIESGGNDPEVIAEQLAELSGYDIYRFAEVSPANADRYPGGISPR